MKAKKLRVQEGEFDFATLSEEDMQIYIFGLIGSLISTISTQCLVSPFTVSVVIRHYLDSFDEDNYLKETRFAREYIQKLIKG